MGGYLFAQVMAAGIGLLADAGFVARPDLNYSSFGAVMTMILIMVVMLISALYPAWVAAKSASNQRR